MGSSFDRLPAELRHFIWTLTLGEHGDAPTMVPFRTARPWLLEEEDDDDELLMGGDDADEFMSDEQFEEIRLLALRQVAGQNENEDTAGPVPPAPMTLPSNGVITIADDDVDDGAGEGDGQDDATNEAPIGDEGENDDDDDDDDDEEDEEVEESEDEFQGSLDTDEGEFEPGNPYGQERAWDDEVVIAVYIPPLLLVNREARSVTLNWLKKHDIQLNRNTISKGEINTGFAPNKDGLPPYTRKYDPERDHLYVDRRYWRRFCDRLQMPHMMAPDDNDDADEEEDPVHDIGETIKHLALPAFTMYQSVGVVGNILEFLPNIQQIACIWGDLPHKEWKPRIVYETVQRDGKPMTQVTNVLLPRWDHAQISEKLSQEEHDRRNDDTERIKAEREKDRQERQEKKDQAEKNGRTNEEDEEDDDEDEDDDDEEEEEGTGPIVTMCIRDPSDDTKVFYERGYLSNWLDEIYNELSICELPEHVTDEYDGSVTLPIVPCNAVLRQ